MIKKSKIFWDCAHGNFCHGVKHHPLGILIGWGGGGSDRIISTRARVHHVAGDH